MLTLKDLSSEFLNGTPRDALVAHLVKMVKCHDYQLQENRRFRNFEAACLNILSEFAPWENHTKDGRVLSALLEAIDEIQDKREEEDP